MAAGGHPAVRRGDAAAAQGRGRVEPRPGAPTTQEAATVRNPLFVDRAPTAADYARGKVYYDSYCVFCHNANGDGQGPVGQSFVPFPADLRTARVRAYSDGQLLRAMLTGPGHEPVLAYTVHPEHRWYLVLYVRSLAGGQP